MSPELLVSQACTEMDFNQNLKSILDYAGVALIGCLVTEMDIITMVVLMKVSILLVVKRIIRQRL